MSQAPPTRRRWFQFSLGTMSLAVRVLAIWLLGLIVYYMILDGSPLGWAGAVLALVATAIFWRTYRSGKGSPTRTNRTSGIWMPRVTVSACTNDPSEREAAIAWLHAGGRS